MKFTHQLSLMCAATLTLVCGFTQAQTAQIPQRIRPTTPPGAQPPSAVPPSALLPPAPAKPTNPVPPPSGKYYIDYPATPLAEVLEDYYTATKRRVLRDRGLESATVSIEVPGEFTAEEYQSIIEKGLLMHGYALVPSGENLYKLIAAEQGTSPSSQGVPVILRSEDLPTTDQVVSHVIQLNYLQAEEASTALQQLIPLHPYGKILAMANARALVITEASQTIRAYLDLVKQVDVSPMETMQKTFILQRATASEVVDQLSSLLGLGGSGGSGGGTTARPMTGAPPIPGQAVGGAPAAAVGTSAAMGGAGGVSPEASKPILQAIERNNAILVIARPTDMQRIESLITELDAESTNRRYFSRRLNYLDLTVFLKIAEQALQRNSKTSGTGSSLASQANTPSGSPPTNNTFGNNSSFGSNSGLNSGLGGGLGGGGLGSSGGGMSSGAAPQLDVTKKPLSVLIANTLVIADPASSKFFASGPPDQIQALEELADELDVRPRQIHLSAIIGEFTLGDDFNFGLDWIQTLRKVGEEDLVGGVLNTQGTAFANPANLRDITGFLAAGGPSALSGLTAYGQIGKNLNVFLQTLESTRRFHVLQKPTVTTLNHQPATIYIGQQIAIAGQTFTNGAAGNNGLGFTSTTQYIPVRLQLDITPHIYNDNEVMLEFKQQNNDISGFNTIGGNRVPNISEQGMQNSLIVPDRATAMLGGLITERDTKNNNGLPFLVRIPVIKHLFGSTNNTKERRELMIFVQPRIMPDEASQMLDQAKMGDHIAGYNETIQFGGLPESGVPEALPSGNKPNDLLPPANRTVGPQKTFLGKIKSFFSKDKSQPQNKPATAR
jgi:general secretion pathway protein D